MLLEYNATLDKWVLANPVNNNAYALLQNKQTQNTGGGTSTAGAWNIIPLNTEQTDAYNIVDSTALPAFTLAKGTYRIKGHSPFFNVDLYQTRLYNVTNSVAIAYGPSGFMSNDDSVTGTPLIATFTLTASAQLRFEYQVGGTSVNGLGIPANYGPEVYAQLEITKIG
jgi:hypothetical protein